MDLIIAFSFGMILGCAVCGFAIKLSRPAPHADIAKEQAEPLESADMKRTNAQIENILNYDGTKRLQQDLEDI